MIYFLKILFSIFIFDLIVLGPQGLVINDISTRKILFALIMAISILSWRPKYNENHILFIMIFISILFIQWGLLVPALRGGSFALAFQEATPIFSILLILPISLLFNEYGKRYFISVSFLSSGALSLVLLAAWASATYLSRPDISFSIKQAYETINSSAASLYIGYMPDGSFRTMIIGVIVIPFLFHYTIIKKDISRLWIPIFLFVTVASSTRALIISMIVIILAAISKKIKIQYMVYPISVLIIIVVYFIVSVDYRAFSIIDDIDLNSPRRVQFFALLDLFSQHPWLGSGFGASADYIRSETAPYSYEFTYIALLAKLGIIGCLFVFTSVTILLSKLIKKSPENGFEIIFLTAIFVFITATNPYLLNFHGMTLAAFLISMATQGQLQKIQSSGV